MSLPGKQGTLPSRLPSPRVRFGADLFERLGRLSARIASARERREGAGRHGLLGAGTEFVGYRPYRPGEDMRLFDWQLYSRLRQPFVRVARREASEHWAVLLDTSASMGVGRAGKLQCAAEVAAALCALARKEGADVTLVLSGTKSCLRVGQRTPLRAALAFLETAEAAGNQGLAPLLLEPARFRDAGALFVLGDLLDLEPRDVLELCRRGRDLFCLRLLAAEELNPPIGAPIHWVDPETRERETLFVDEAAAARYREQLDRELDVWKVAAARHRMVHGCWQSDIAFEAVIRDLFGA